MSFVNKEFIFVDLPFAPNILGAYQKFHFDVSCLCDSLVFSFRQCGRFEENLFESQEKKSINSEK